MSSLPTQSQYIALSWKWIVPWYNIIVTKSQYYSFSITVPQIFVHFKSQCIQSTWNIPCNIEVQYFRDILRALYTKELTQSDIFLSFHSFTFDPDISYPLLLCHLAVPIQTAIMSENLRVIYSFISIIFVDNNALKLIVCCRLFHPVRMVVIVIVTFCHWPFTSIMSTTIIAITILYPTCLITLDLIN